MNEYSQDDALEQMDQETGQKKGGKYAGSYSRVKRWRKAHPERHLEIKARYTARSKGRRAAYFKWWTGERRKKRQALREAERAKTPPGGI